MSLQRYRHSSSLPSCFRPFSSATTISDNNNNHTPPSPPPSQQISGKTNLSTSLHNTNLGIFSLTWSRTTFLGHSLNLHLHPHLHFHLSFNSFSFWKKHGCKKLSSSTVTNVKLYWDLSRAKFGPGPEPESGFFIAVVVDNQMMLLVGDATKEAYARTKAQIKPVKTQTQQGLVLRKEHVFGNKVYTTKARFGGKMREISIDCRVNEDAKLCFRVDNKRVLQIKRLKWKFRGNERIEVDGVFIQVSWDVYNWLFDKDLSNGHAVFVFKFENDHQGSEVLEENEKNGDVLWQQSSCSSSSNGIEWKKMRRNLLRTARSSSSSSISMSSASSVGSSSVMEWISVEESELSAPIGFSLLVYAWRK